LAADVARDDACRTTPPSSRTRRPEVGAEDGRQEEEAEAGGEKQRAVHVVNTSRFSERYYRKEKLLKKKVHGFCLSDVEGQHKYEHTVSTAGCRDDAIRYVSYQTSFAMWYCMCDQHVTDRTVGVSSFLVRGCLPAASAARTSYV
jgi:hypothetical protein